MAGIRADLILRAIARRHREDLFLTQVLTGATRGEYLVLDGVAFRRSWAAPCVIGYEVKVSRKDFVRDNKWHGYVGYCHRFYMVCPVGVIQAEELPDEVGLLWYEPETQVLLTRRRARHRNVPLSVDLLYSALINRGQSERHPFFSERREFLEAWVEDRQERQELGRLVGTAMAVVIAEQAAELEALRRELEWLRKESEELQALREGLRGLGYETEGPGWVEGLVRQLGGGVPGQAVRQLRRVREQVDWVLQMLEGGRRDMA